MTAPLLSLGRAVTGPAKVRMAVVHRKSKTAPGTRALAPGIEALDFEAFVDTLNKPESRRIRRS